MISSRSLQHIKKETTLSHTMISPSCPSRTGNGQSIVWNDAVRVFAWGKITDLEYMQYRLRGWGTGKCSIPYNESGEKCSRTEWLYRISTTSAGFDSVVRDTAHANRIPGFIIFHRIYPARIDNKPFHEFRSFFKRGIKGKTRHYVSWIYSAPNDAITGNFCWRHLFNAPGNGNTKEYSKFLWKKWRDA